MRTLTPDRYLSKNEVNRLRQAAEEKAIVDITKGRKTWDKIWMMIDLVTSTGMRVKELAELQVRDIKLGHEPSVYVRYGKGRRSRNILIDKDYTAFKKHVKEFIERYRLTETDYLLNINGKPYSTMGLQNQFKRVIREASLPGHYSIHCARHTYATYLYEKKKDLRMVQQQLGHAHPSTTAIYAQATKESTYEALSGLYD